MSDKKSKKLDDEQLEEVDGGLMPVRGEDQGNGVDFGPNTPERPIQPDAAVD